MNDYIKNIITAINNKKPVIDLKSKVEKYAVAVNIEEYKNKLKNKPMKKLLILLAFFCLGQIAVATNYVGLPKYMVIEYLNEGLNPKYGEVKVYNDSAHLFFFDYPNEKYTYYFNDGICTKQNMVGSYTEYDFYNKDCMKNFGASVMKNVWIAKGVYKELPEYRYIITLETINNKCIYTISGYSNFLEYLCNLLF